MSLEIGQAAREHEARFFVGRERELAAFEAWLADDDPALLSVSGPGGVGKTALLRACERTAREAGRPVVAIDGRAPLRTPRAALAALGHETLDDAVAALNASRPLLMIDTFEALGPLTRFLRDDLLPRLDAGVRVAVAGRDAPGTAWLDRKRWPRAVRCIALEHLSRGEGRSYLQRRGIEAEIAEQIVESCGGWPLALSLAADLVQQFGVRRLPATPQWRAADPGLRALLEAGAVVRQFDEEALTALTGGETGEAFAALCRLSVVRPAPRGLALHDDVRRLVEDDLRWRRPQRHAELRLRALEHYNRRAARSSPAERERVLEERLFLWEHEVVQSLLYTGDEPGEVWVEPARPEDREQLVALHHHWQTVVRPALGLVPADAAYSADEHDEWFAATIAHPAARARIARDRNDAALGYDVVLTVCEDTLELCERHPVIGAAVRAYLSTPAAAPLAARAEDSDVVFLAHLGLSGELPEATRGALIRDLLSVLVQGGVCLASLELDEYRRLADALGFRPVARSDACFRGVEYRGYALDLRHIGTELWLQTLLAGGPLPPTGPGELEAHVRDLLAAWHDDRRLAESPLAALADPRAGDRPAALRSLLGAALQRARAACRPEGETALRAVELAYVEQAASHEQLAARLHVSRATFYRLLHRGVELLAATLAAAAGELRQDRY